MIYVIKERCFIIESAFGLRAAAGGALGSVMIAMQKGIARGIFSNEAGLGIVITGTWDLGLEGVAVTTKALLGFRWLYIIAIFIGPYMTVAAVWIIADIFNGLMAFPNLIALVALSGVFVKETKNYFEKLK